MTLSVWYIDLSVKVLLIFLSDSVNEICQICQNTDSFRKQTSVSLYEGVIELFTKVICSKLLNSEMPLLCVANNALQTFFVSGSTKELSILFLKCMLLNDNYFFIVV